MKESSYHDTKMVAYRQEVQRLEDKFNGLELNHIRRCLNEAVDSLAKVAFGREPVPMGVFTNDQHKPSMRYEGSKRADDGPSDLALGANQPMTLSSPEVMELEEDLAIEPNPLIDWRMLYLNYLLHDMLPTDKMEARRFAHHAKSFVLVEGELYK
jgi:hypothetical protein